MAWTQSDLDAINAAIAVGSRMVRHGETMVEYRTLEEMWAIRTAIMAELTPTKVPRRTVVKFSSGV